MSTGELASPGPTIGASVVRIAHLYPTVLGLYGDRGNALVLAHRARARGIAAEIVDVAPGDKLPEQADVYLLGGGEDIAQTTACELLRADGALGRAIERGAPILAICAGYQILGTEFAAGGRQVPGLGLLDLVTRTRSVRAVGELVAEPVEDDLPTLTGYENHGGGTTLGPGLAPLAVVRAGIGNGGAARDRAVGDGTAIDRTAIDRTAIDRTAIDRTEGVRHGRVIGTYCHGPALARNPALADLVLGWIAGGPLPAMPGDLDAVVGALRAERLAAVAH